MVAGFVLSSTMNGNTVVGFHNLIVINHFWFRHVQPATASKYKSVKARVGSLDNISHTPGKLLQCVCVCLY